MRIYQLFVRNFSQEGLYGIFFVSKNNNKLCEIEGLNDSDYRDIISGKALNVKSRMLDTSLLNIYQNGCVVLQFKQKCRFRGYKSNLF